MGNQGDRDSKSGEKKATVLPVTCCVERMHAQKTVQAETLNY